MGAACDDGASGVGKDGMAERRTVLLAAGAAAAGVAGWASLAGPRAHTRYAWGVRIEHRDLACRIAGLPGVTRLRAALFRPIAAAAGERLPLAVVTHGMVPTGFARARTHPLLLSGPAIELALRGYAVCSVVRRGYGASGGAFAETGSWSRPNHEGIARAGGRDLRAAAGAMAALPGVDASRTLVLGHSVGGLAALGSAAVWDEGGGDPAVSLGAVVNVSGGMTTSRGPPPDTGGEFGRLGASLARDAALASGGRSPPALFVYPSDDAVITPGTGGILARSWMSAAGDGAIARVSDGWAADRGDGHGVLVSSPASVWWPPIGAFLAEAGMPGGGEEALPPPMTPAPPPGVPAEPWWEWARLRVLEKAFAFDPESGAFAWYAGAETVGEARREAMRGLRGGGGARVVAEADRLLARR